MTTDYIMPDDDISPFLIPTPDPLDTTPINGGGNGIDGRIATVTRFNISTEGSNNQSIKNLLIPCLKDTSNNYYSAKWGNGIGQGVNLTYSFSTSNSTYSYSDSDTSNKSAFSNNQQSCAVSVMNAWAAVANVTFTVTTDSATRAGDIRWSNSSATSTAHGTPAEWDLSVPAKSGDIWVNPNPSHMLELQPGQYGNQTMIHEMGHVLGLAHPHQAAVVGPVAGEDQLKYSIMSYRGYDGSSTGYYLTADYFFPTTPMLNDISAAQFLYGANTTYHTGNDTYSWVSTAHVYETIWDAGGTDTISAATQTQAATINLNSGQWSKIGVPFSNGSLNSDNSVHYINDGLTIAYGATIENATGSAYADTLIGNSVNNLLNGGAGNDTLRGGYGNDLLLGLSGQDTYNPTFRTRLSRSGI